MGQGHQHKKKYHSVKAVSPIFITLIYQNLHPWPDRTLPSIINSSFKPFPEGHYSHSLHDHSPDIMFQMLPALSLISYSLFPQSQLSRMMDAAGGPLQEPWFWSSVPNAVLRGCEELAWNRLCHIVCENLIVITNYLVRNIKSCKWGFHIA